MDTPLNANFINMLIHFGTNYLMLVMFATFFVGAFIRGLIYYTIRSEKIFSIEFEKRVHKHFNDLDVHERGSFYRLLKVLLGKTFYESFELRHRYRRRKMDHITTLADRAFLIQEGVARLIKDTLKHSRYLKKDGTKPHLTELSKSVFESNPVFTKIFGVLPIRAFNDLLDVLPGLFVIAGIFGTFLGIMKGLPDLGHMEIGNPEQTKQVIDVFLIRISHSMGASVTGIFFYILMTLVNTMFSAEGQYFSLVNRFSHALEYIWNETDSNEWSAEDLAFDEWKDIEASGKPDKRVDTDPSNLPPPPKGSGDEEAA